MPRNILVILFICIISLASCRFLPPPGSRFPAATVFPAPTVTLEPASTPTPTVALTPSPEPRPALALGQPKWLGRGRIISAFFTPDGAAIAIGWATGVSLVDVDGAAERWWQPTGAPVIALDVHPEGKAVAAALADGSLMVFNAGTGAGQRFEGAGAGVDQGDIAWSPDGERLAFQFVGRAGGGPIYVLDVERGTSQPVAGSHISPGKTPALVWTPDGRAITRTDFGQACTAVLDVETGETLFTLQIGAECYFPYAMTWSPDGELFALAGSDGVALVDPGRGEIVRKLDGPVLGYTLSGEAFSRSGHPLLFNANGTLIAGKGGVADLGSGGDFDNLFPAVVWNVETGEQMAQLGQRGDAYELGLENEDRAAMAFDGDSLLSLYEKGEITRWALGVEPAEEVIIGQIPVIAPERPLAWSANGRRLAAPNRYGGAAVWEVAAGALAARYEAPLEGPALSPDGRLLALTDREAQQLVIFDLEAGEVVATLPEASSLPEYGAPPSLGAAFSPDGASIAYRSRNRVFVADVASGERLATLEGYPDDQAIIRVSWAPDGEALVAVSGDPLDGAAGHLILWQQSEDGSFTEVFHSKTIHASNEAWPVALFNPAGRLVALEQAPSDSETLETLVYDRQTEEVILTLEGYRLVAWVSDEVLLALEAGGWSQLTRWNVRTGEQELGARGMEFSEVYAPGGTFYARPMEDERGSAISFWATGEVVAEASHYGQAAEIAWSPDGRWLASLTHNGTIRVWPVER